MSLPRGSCSRGRNRPANASSRPRAGAADSPKYWKQRRIILFQMGAMSQLRFLTSCSSPHRRVLTWGRSAFPPAWAQAGTPRGGVIPESGSRITVPSSCLPSDPSPFPFPLPPSSTLGSYPQSDDSHDTAGGAQVALKSDFSCPQRGPAELPGQPRRASPAPPNQRCPRDSAGGEEQPVGPGLREGEEVEVTARDRRKRRDVRKDRLWERRGVVRAAPQSGS